MKSNSGLILRAIIIAVVIGIFAWSMHPLRERDYYEVFTELFKNPDDAELKQLINDAKTLQTKEPQRYQFQSEALLTAAGNKGIDLSQRVKGQDLQDNRDVMSLIRKQASSSIRLGLDLRGGVEFLLQLIPDEEFLSKLDKDAKKGESRAEMEQRMKSEFNRYRDIAIEILRKRLESQKIFEAEIAPSGGDYVALRAPIVAKDEKHKLLDIIKMSAKLRFRLVAENNDEMVEEYLKDKENFQIPHKYELMTTQEFRPGEPTKTRYFFVEKRSQMDGKNITQAIPTRDQFGQRKIALAFNQEGAEEFHEVTKRNIHRALAIVLDGKLYCAPVIQSEISGGHAEISGSFSDDEIKSISDALVSGSFPFQIKVDAVFDTDPKLGADNVKNGIWAGILSLVVVAVFMVMYYRLSGLISVVALWLNTILILGAMAAFDCTLTLPGIAGVVLTIGMAVDANVLVFERIREELNAGKSLQNAVDYGYDKAFSAVLDANLTTLLTSFILMYVGTGAVKGFAVSLSIGILTSLFTALFVTRFIFDCLFKFTSFNKVSFLTIFKKPNFDFNKMWGKALCVSLAFILLAFITLGVRRSGVLGVDFTGGTTVTFNYSEKISPDQIETLLLKNGYQEPTVTYKENSIGGQSERKIEILVRGDLTKHNAEKSPKDTLQEILNKSFPKANFNSGDENTIGGLIGWEFTKAALWAIFFSVIGIGLYITLRYEHRYAISGVIALLHDVIVVTGIFLVTGRTVSLTAVAAILTVIGYSINDTVVIFDRIRENISNGAFKTFDENVNASINQTLSRTLLTSITTFIVVLILFIGGGVAINDFVFIMMLGIIVGTYSSVFIAAPLLCYWHNRGSKKAVASSTKRA